MDNELFERHVKNLFFTLRTLDFLFLKRSLYPVNDYCGMKGKKEKEKKDIDQTTKLNIHMVSEYLF